jgi:pantoate--beta-alanine ligase
VKIIRTVSEMKNFSITYQKSGKTVGLVPTMGALHNGHLSLVDIAKSKSDLTVMSIFVNPTQFGPSEDFRKYPRTFDMDCEKAQAAGCDIVFAPTDKEMYPLHYNTYVSVENITDRLCGASRPGHFRGVATVVLKLFNIIMPQTAVFGQKDAQQVIVIKRMIHDLNLSIKIKAAPIIRDEDGLAMSSRNAYLTNDERREASIIYSGLRKALSDSNGGERNASKLKDTLKREYEKIADILSVEYIEIVDLTNVQPLDIIPDTALIAVACRTKQSNTRLIDNIVVGGSL